MFPPLPNQNILNTTVYLKMTYYFKMSCLGKGGGRLSKSPKTDKWENSCSFGLRYVSWYKYLIVSLVFFPPRFLEWESFSDCAFS